MISIKRTGQGRLKSRSFPSAFLNSIALRSCSDHLNGCEARARLTSKSASPTVVQLTDAPRRSSGFFATQEYHTSTKCKGGPPATIKTFEQRSAWQVGIIVFSSATTTRWLQK